jgi:hypothetical protein
MGPGERGAKVLLYLMSGLLEEIRETLGAEAEHLLALLGVFDALQKGHGLFKRGDNLVSHGVLLVGVVLRASSQSAWHCERAVGLLGEEGEVKVE